MFKRGQYEAWIVGERAVDIQLNVFLFNAQYRVFESYVQTDLHTDDKYCCAFKIKVLLLVHNFIKLSIMSL